MSEIRSIFKNIKDVDCHNMLIIPSGKGVEWRKHMVQPRTMEAAVRTVEILKTDGRFDRIDVLAPLAKQEERCAGFQLILQVERINDVWTERKERA